MIKDLQDVAIYKINLITLFHIETDELVNSPSFELCC